MPGGGGCYAQIPYRTGGGRLEIGLQQTGCVHLSVVVHELLHSLGFGHEQNRPDRDDYVEMHWDNIRAGGAGQFFIESWVDSSPPFDTKCEENNKPDGDDDDPLFIM